MSVDPFSLVTDDFQLSVFPHEHDETALILTLEPCAVTEYRGTRSVIEFSLATADEFAKALLSAAALVDRGEDSEDPTMVHGPGWTCAVDAYAGCRAVLLVFMSSKPPIYDRSGIALEFDLPTGAAEYLAVLLERAALMAQPVGGEA